MSQSSNRFDLLGARALRFVGVGGLATLVHVAVAMGAEAGFGLGDLTANLAGWLAAVTLSYFGHLHLTFGVTPAHDRQAPRFVLTALAGLAISSALVALVTGAGGSFAVAMAVVAVGVPVLTYLTLSLWVFETRTARAPLALSDLGVLILAGLCLLGVFWGQMLHHDVVWYHVATRQWLAGAALYAEIVEVNPPLNFYLTLPVIWLADLTGLDDGAAQYLLLAGLLTASLWLVARELQRVEGLGIGARAGLLAGLGVAVTALALRDVGQREHLFILMSLPWIVSRVAPAPRPSGAGLGLAVLAAVAMCLKPFFVVFPAAVLILDAIRARSLAPLISGAALVFLGTGLAYVAAVAWLHPSYLTETLPMAGLVYGAYGAPLIDVVGVVGPSLAVLLLAGLWTVTRPAPPRGAVLFFAVSGAGVVSYLWQGTGFTYHALPFVIFGAMGCLFACFDPRTRVVALIALATLTLEVGHRGFYDNGAVTRIVPVTEAHGPVARLLVVTPHVFAGPIVAEHAGAEWASPYPAQWLLPGALNALGRTDCASEPERCAAIQAVADRNRTDLIASMREGQPDMIVFDKTPGYFDVPNFDWHGWLGGDPAYAGILAGYGQVAEDDRFTYWALR